MPRAPRKCPSLSLHFWLVLLLSGRVWVGGRGRGAGQAVGQRACQPGGRRGDGQGWLVVRVAVAPFPCYKWLVLNGPERSSARCSCAAKRTLYGEDRSRR